MLDPNMQTQRLWTSNFFILIIANFALFIAYYMLFPTLPVYIKEITGKDALTGLAMGSLLLAAVLFRPFAGRLIDTGKRKAVFLFGTAIFFLCTISFNLAPVLLILLAARFIQGFGWAYCNTAAGTLASDIIPKPRLAEGMGYYGLSLSLGMAIGPALGLFLIQGYGFQFMFNICAGYVFLSFLLALLIKYSNLKIAATKKPLSLKTIFEKKAIHPSLVIFFTSIGYAAVVSFLALFGQERHVSDVGLFFVVYAISLTISRPFFGRLADTKGYDMVVVSGLILCSLAMTIIYFAHTLPVFILAGMVYGIGYGAVQPTTQALSVLYVPMERRGSATATFFLFLDLGMCLGAVMWGVVAHYFGYGLMYLMVIIPTLLALLVYLLFPREAEKQQELSIANS
ncbi:Purine efflux pump PbuE [Sporotomaculum syntrophicum]|uniref:Purine efflux pump PbuE n=1 Tax=Sporotomaculum syntrophicum TaxID=182264 RepID=A0A9D3AWK2_9FIRM|nr:MFS transporter [Sporotomaculum syntrophicum]KAF1085540.1 Purine efflux pump PbuE [Sporotomaculum syntrophicum]